MIRSYDPDVLESTPKALPIPHARSHIFQGKPYGCDVWSDIAQLPVAQARTPPFQRNPFGVTWRLMTSHPVAMLLPVIHNGTFCTTTIVRKMHWNWLCMRTRSLPVTWLPVPVTWLPVTSIPVRAASGDVTSGSSSWNGTLAVPIYYLPKTLRFEWKFLFNTTYVHLS
jgi:hypothetical protein